MAQLPSIESTPNINIQAHTILNSHMNMKIAFCSIYDSVFDTGMLVTSTSLQCWYSVDVFQCYMHSNIGSTVRESAFGLVEYSFRARFSYVPTLLYLCLHTHLNYKFIQKRTNVLCFAILCVRVYYGYRFHFLYKIAGSLRGRYKNWPLDQG